MIALKEINVAMAVGPKLVYKSLFKMIQPRMLPRQTIKSSHWESTNKLEDTAFAFLLNYIKVGICIIHKLIHPSS